jgi:hypothetical protein
MKKTMLSLALTLGCALALGTPAAAQNKKPQPYSTQPKLVPAKIKQGEADVFEVRGKASFTVTSANTDDTINGTITYTLPEEARKKLAELSGKKPAEIPATLTRPEVVAAFQKATACPVVHLEFNPMDFDVAGQRVHFSRLVLDVPDGPDEVAKHICVWTKQINGGRSRRGVIASLNRYINGETNN